MVLIAEIDANSSVTAALLFASKNCF